MDSNFDLKTGAFLGVIGSLGVLAFIIFVYNIGHAWGEQAGYQKANEEVYRQLTAAYTGCRQADGQCDSLERQLEWAAKRDF